MYLAQGKIHVSRAVSTALHNVNHCQFSNVKTLEGFLERFRTIKLGDSTTEIIYSQFQAEITSACPNWDFSTINYSKMQVLSNLLKHYKANNVPVLFALQKQFTKSFPNTKSLSFSDSLAVVQMLAPENIAESNFLKQSYEHLAEKYLKDPNKKERKIGNFAWMYAYFNLPDPKITDFFINELQQIISTSNSPKNHMESNYLAKIGFYLSYEYKKAHNLQEMLLRRIENEIEQDRVSFYKYIKDVEYLWCLWTWFHSIELYDNDLYLRYKEKVCKKIPFQFNKKEVKPSRQQEFGDFLRSLLQKQKIKQEELIGIYQVDFVIEDSNVVIEYNGKGHYINFSQRETGKHWIRARNIRDSGYKLVDIAYYEWNGLTTLEEKHEYLKKKLRAAGVEI